MPSPTTPKQRHITLTDRPPALIREDQWPVIAEAACHDGTIEAEATRRWTMKVRQHHDGRTLVYGVHTSRYPSEPDWRGGELLEDDSTVAAAIRRVGKDGGMPDHLIRECIADLPPEEL